MFKGKEEKNLSNMVDLTSIQEFQPQCKKSSRKKKRKKKEPEKGNYQINHGRKFPRA